MQVSQDQLKIGADPMEVGRARRWARARLAGCGVAEADEQLAETVVLLVSELVTNAVVHTGRPAVLCLSLPEPGTADDGAGDRYDQRAGVASGPAGCPGAGTGALRVEVADASSTEPSPRHAEGEDTGGRGLELVSGLADRWGWHHEGDGKRIWCEFDGASGDGRLAAADSRTARLGPPVPPRPRGPLALRPTH